jgi:hypothetical protein
VLGGISYGRINFGVVLGGAPGCLPCLFRRGAPLNLPVRRGVQILRAEGIDFSLQSTVNALKDIEGPISIGMQ